MRWGWEVVEGKRIRVERKANFTVAYASAPDTICISVRGHVS